MLSFILVYIIITGGALSETDSSPRYFDELDLDFWLEVPWNLHSSCDLMHVSQVPRLEKCHSWEESAVLPNRQIRNNYPAVYQQNGGKSGEGRG